MQSKIFAQYGLSAESMFSANPIRRVVTMLQMMGKKVEAEGKKEKELFDKFMCYCKTSGGDLKASISSNTAKVPELQSEIEAAEAQLSQTKQELEQHQADRDAAKSKMSQATAMRDKEHAAFVKEKEGMDTNINALTKAIPAIEKGMSGGFLQTNTAALIRKVAMTDFQLSDDDRDALSAFLQGGTSTDEDDEYSQANSGPSSAQIVGILKQMLDEMNKDIAGIISSEEASQKTYDELMAAMTKEVEAHTVAIEKKSILIGELGVNIVTMKNDLTDSEEALIEDQKFLADLDKDCALKSKEWDERCKTRSEEILAIQETIKILNSDDALDLFKKTLPSPSLLQVKLTMEAVRNRALSVLRVGKRNLVQRDRSTHPIQVDFVELALGSKKVDFTKVVKMIDDMVVHLGKEQTDDDNKKEYCETQLDQTEDKAKELEHSIDDLDTEIASQEESISTLKEEIKALKDSIAALDKSVAEATQQRKEENEEYTELMSSNTAAKELIEFAKNRMQKFYNPKLYKPPPKEAPAFTQVGAVTVHSLKNSHTKSNKKDAPPPPPETFGGYEKKSEESGGVLAMMDNLVRDLDKEMTEASMEEKDAQGDYEEMMADAAAKRAESIKAITEKESAKADAETDHSVSTGARKETDSELQATKQYLSELHGDCDWLLQNFDLRKTARADEIDALKKAKAVLSGADFSFMQVDAVPDNTQ